jgi:hypothetical protein
MKERTATTSSRAPQRKQPYMEMIEVDYRATVEDPAGAARQVNAFLGGGLDEAAMAAAVKASLYRNRA